jgi:carbohydrate diacid regulator
LALVISRQIANEIVSSIHDIFGQDTFYAQEGTITACTDGSRLGDYHILAEEAEKQDEAIPVIPDPLHPAWREGIVFRFLFNGSVAGSIGMEGDFDSLSRYVMIARKIATLILREQELNAQSRDERTQISYVMHALITKEGALNADYIIDFLTSRHLKNFLNYRIIVVAYDSRINPGNLVMVEKEILTAFERTGSDLYSFNYPNEYVLMLEDSECTRNAALFESLAQKNPDLLKIGIGDPLHVEHMPESYQAARTALMSLKNSARNLAWYDRLGADALLSDLSASARAQYMQKTLRDLNENEQTILNAYFQNSCSLKTTSEKLYIHRNTLQYQLDRIHEKTGLNPRTFSDAVTLYLALHLKAQS